MSATGNGRHWPPATTNDAGVPVASDEFALTAGPDGPVLLQDAYLNEKLAHFVRERVPDRVYHVKGSGAFGYFEVTADVTGWTKAAFLGQVGERTPVLVRFSTVAGEEGYADTDRDVRGVAMKFYTEEGNYDLVGNDTPVFFVRDAMKFPDFIHSQERMPDTGLRSNNMQWDFWTLSPESSHQVMTLMSDRGTPRTYRHMHAFSSSTYLWENAAGQKVWVKYHFKTEQGIENFTDAEAKAMRGEDPDYHRRDLRAAIDRKDYPVWRLEMQIMPFEDAANYRFNPFDITKVWPHKDYPTIPIGRMVLDPIPRTSPRSRRSRSRWRTSSRASGPARIAWCWGGCSPTATRPAIATARTIFSCRSTSRSTRCTTTTRTARCATTTRVGTIRSTRRTAMAARGPTPSATATRAGLWRRPRLCARPMLDTRTTTTSSSPARSTAR